MYPASHPLVFLLARLCVWFWSVATALAMPPTVRDDFAAPQRCDLQAFKEQLLQVDRRIATSPFPCKDQELLARIVSQTRSCPHAEPLLGMALYLQATCFEGAGDIHLATPAYEESVEILQADSKAPYMLAGVLADLSGHYLQLSRLDDAVRTSAQALRLMGEHQIRNEKARLRALTAQATAHTYRGRESDAIKLYRQVLSEFSLSECKEGTALSVAVATVNYADLIVGRHPQEALAQIDPLVSWAADRRLAGGSDAINGILALAKCVQAKAYYVQGDFAAAESHALTGIQLAESYFNPLDTMLADFRASIAEIYFDSKNYGEAEKLYTAVIAAFDDHGIVNSNLRVALVNYAVILRKTKRKTEAKVLEERVRQIDASPEGLLQRSTVDWITIAPPTNGGERP
ncbi:MAG: hypothetical protein U5J83_12560 [Bryobacterales bacterium]|nr:hypothetical protein [Bryobacterales bacterium]